ncbi:MAG: glucosylceramidase, partial [Flavobacterium sp.]
MKTIFNTCLLASMLFASCACKKNASTTSQHNKPETLPVKSEVGFWLTKGDQSQLLSKQNVALNFSETTNANPTIEVDPSTTFQEIDGFGYTLTGGSASLINALPAAEKDKLIQELFAVADDAISVNYIRISIGGSDLSAYPFTYNDLADGETDESLVKFSIAKEQTDLIPILKKIVAINPKIKILGSPWTAPIWMKSNKSFIGGNLKPEYYQTYAKYLVKYIQA